MRITKIELQQALTRANKELGELRHKTAEQAQTISGMETRRNGADGACETHNAQLTKERDEARTYARALHAKHVALLAKARELDASLTDSRKWRSLFESKWHAEKAKREHAEAALENIISGVVA